MNGMNEETIGAILQDLRDTRSLREVCRDSGITAGYLSMIEKGLRRPGPNVLRRLAATYGVDAHDLLRRAGHLDIEDSSGSQGEELDWAFDFVLRDPRFRLIVKPDEPMNGKAKRFIVEMYEKLTGKRLLD